MNIWYRIWLWQEKADWRSWITHAVAAVPLALLFGDYATSLIYLFREVLHIEMYVDHGEQPHYLDHVMDFVAPYVVASAMAHFLPFVANGGLLF